MKIRKIKRELLLDIWGLLLRINIENRDGVWDDVSKKVSQLLKENKMTTTQEKIKVMQAFCEGKAIQYRKKDSLNQWYNVGVEPIWDWNQVDYRIKPEPRVIYVNEYAEGLAHVHFNSEVEAKTVGYNTIRQIKFVEVLEDDV